MFEFLKKKSAGAKAAEPAKVAAEPVKIDDNMAIHVMPERFRNQPVKQDSAKNIGLAIIVGGLVVLFIVSGVLYYFLFSQPKAVTAPEQPSAALDTQPSATVKSQPEASEQNATSSEATTLPIENELATSTAATSTPESVMATTTVSYSLGVDSDSDGLFDKEEILLGTSSSTPDSDADSYLDGFELLNIYDPAGKGKLTANPAITVYENKTFSYSLLYPEVFKTSLSGGDDSVMFNTGDNQFIQAIVQPNANGQSLDAWYLEQLDLAEVDLSSRASGVGWLGIKNPDGLTVYLMDSKQKFIFSLSYNAGGGEVLDYFNIFQMMIKSLMLKE